MSRDIDNEFVTERNFEFRDTMRWWERKRIWYNGIVLFCQAVMIEHYYEGFWAYGIRESVVLSLFFLLAANICYCLGWGLELILTYYFKSFKLNSTHRTVLFLLGILCTGLVTISLYHDVYINHQYYSQFV